MQTEVVVQHPDIVFYDFYGAWDDPVEADMQSYLCMVFYGYEYVK